MRFVALRNAENIDDDYMHQNAEERKMQERLIVFIICVSISAIFESYI